MKTESTAVKKEAPPRPPPPKLFPDGDTPYKGDAPLSGMPYNFCLKIGYCDSSHCHGSEFSQLSLHPVVVNCITLVNLSFVDK